MVIFNLNKDVIITH